MSDKVKELLDACDSFKRQYDVQGGPGGLTRKLPSGFHFTIYDTVEDAREQHRWMKHELLGLRNEKEEAAHTIAALQQRVEELKGSAIKATVSSGFPGSGFPIFECGLCGADAQKLPNLVHQDRCPLSSKASPEAVRDKTGATLTAGGKHGLPDLGNPPIWTHHGSAPRQTLATTEAVVLPLDEQLEKNLAEIAENGDKHIPGITSGVSPCTCCEVHPHKTEAYVDGPEPGSNSNCADSTEAVEPDSEEDQ